MAADSVRLNVTTSLSSLILNGTNILPHNFGLGSASRLDLDCVVKTVGLESLSLVVVVEPVLEGVAISAGELDLEMIVAAGVVAVLSNLDVVGKLSVDIVNALNLTGSLEILNLQIARRIPKRISCLSPHLVNFVVFVEGLQFTKVVAIKVRARDGSSEVEVILINLDQFRNNSVDVASLVLTLESELSTEVVARLLSTNLTRIGSKHVASPVRLFSVTQKLKIFDENIAERNAAGSNSGGTVIKDLNVASAGSLSLMRSNRRSIMS